MSPLSSCATFMLCFYFSCSWGFLAEWNNVNKFARTVKEQRKCNQNFNCNIISYIDKTLMKISKLTSLEKRTQPAYFK